MNILFDFISLQNAGGVGGAAGFTKAVFDDVISQKSKDTNLVGLYDSQKPEGGLYNYKILAAQHGIKIVDVNTYTISNIIEHENIDVFFIAIGQFFAQYDLNGIHCKTVMFIHDIYDIERNDNRIDLFISDPLKDSKVAISKRWLNVFSRRWKKQADTTYSKIIPLYSAKNTVAYTVSKYTVNALHYFFPSLKKEIRVCYSPMRFVQLKKDIENNALRHLIQSGIPYLLMVSANRKYKNAPIAIKVFHRLIKEYPNLQLLTLKYGKTTHANHTDIDFLSDSDLQHAYQHALALIFPSFFEGFGYPPIEAFRYGTPVIASNVTSIPEIAGDAANYFSPFYPVDLYRAIKSVIEAPEAKKDKMAAKYLQLTEIQKKGLNQLSQQILAKQIL